jgi:hypothetical protein
MKINSKEEYIEFFPYKNTEITKFPDKYPCICFKYSEEAGLMGSYWVVNVLYYPDDLTSEKDFELGVYATTKTLFEG